MRKINKVIIHCTAHPTADYLDVLNWHTLPKPKGNGWDDTGYHSFIYNNGETTLGRPIQIQGAHCKGYNGDSLGVCLQGLDKFSFVQLETLRMQIYAWEVMVGHRLNIHAHYELNYTRKSCPNINGWLLREFIRCEKYLERVEIYKKMEV